ncbi:AFR451Cp [Eremothecium gossypii ATCC 10895]|uniref:AFR451Cp n=1 Tax=Eremothecium gossypii (strain ATCC 10895 / CBS 109.51 / FGSC 9923 / NRRL Y-1056) TaxID=284811 RepID=Q752X2_EREGS|nr:AFR451Cp [Eremothecium gossypii ATCC 10895]AAS53822.3 AFR451Cp [Eremothecium gossypii ATCC 10895]AEY98133.1 FAFR451Cp [Eremothecium gossypii FDAG1]
MQDTTCETLNHINKEIKKEYTSLRNRLRSILCDNKFLLEEVLGCFSGLPLVPNERCGLWYCSPEMYETTCYFKSTDGHVNGWDFSVRRLNFHLLPLLAERSGAIIVDSTRRGKKIPDALSKTIPIWCAVLNTLILEHTEGSGEVLFCPPGTVSQLEYNRIQAKLPELVQKLKRVDAISGAELCSLLGGRLLRPFWVYPGAAMLGTTRDLFTGESLQEPWQPPPGVIPLILCTASRQCQDGVDKSQGYAYVQGAADDHELWANGLTPSLFWANVQLLADDSMPEQLLQGHVERIVELHKSTHTEAVAHELPCRETDVVTEHLRLGSVAPCQISDKQAELLEQQYSLVVLCGSSIELSAAAPHPRIRIYPLNSGCKKSSRALRPALIEIIPLISTALCEALPVLICCSSGSDISVGIVLAALCKNYDLEWRHEDQKDMTKTIIKKHLIKLTSKIHGRIINPSRTTLNSVNAFLM